MRGIVFTEISLSPKEINNNRHNDAIVKLSEELSVPVEEVKKLYEETLELFQSASIKDYVPIFVSRCVRERLKHLEQTN